MIIRRRGTLKRAAMLCHLPFAATREQLNVFGAIVVPERDANTIVSRI